MCECSEQCSLEYERTFAFLSKLKDRLYSDDYKTSYTPEEVFKLVIVVLL